MGAVNGRPDPAIEALFCTGPSQPNLIQEFAMADPAFVITVLAGFALVALIAKGVTRL
ncbi:MULTISPECIES: hypothetical protein [unclassified Streptomyces]|jgi:hypothetical protein|uniref:hypothetical protein n=1 Tax=unclassified Streptomyces TaxID=2593676 RepID=UPI003CF788D0